VACCALALGACTGSRPGTFWTEGASAAERALGSGQNQEYFRGYEEADHAAQELWILPRPDATAVLNLLRDGEAFGDPGQRDIPGTGGLVTQVEERTVVVPLAHTDVEGHVQGTLATLAVRQEFENPFDHPIEAVYVFPLPHDAAVTDFLMTIGERTIRGVIREREEAEKLYQEAKRAGIAASLLTQERPNVFTQKVANIAPGEGIDVTVEYFHRVPLRDGWYELVFPMVVGPRYNPAGGGDGIGAVTLATRGSSGQAVEVPYLRPEERSGHDIDFALTLEAGTPIEALECKTHELLVERPAPDRARVRLASEDRLPNRDLVLRYRLAGGSPRSALFLSGTENGKGGWARLAIHPPALLADLPARPMELICVVDCSGSMSGAPLRQCRAAILEALDRLGPRDTFRIIRFSYGADQLDEHPQPATPANLRRARRFVETLSAGGGTEMLSGVRAALRQRDDPERQRLVAFMTDRYIGNEEEVLREVRRAAGETVVFPFGVGSSPNRFLLEGMAREGSGCAAYLGLDDDGSRVMGAFFERTRRPALTSLEIDWGDLEVRDVLPSVLPDLFVGRPIEVLARVGGSVDDLRNGVRVLGRTAGTWRELGVEVRRETSPRMGAAMAKLWARTRIADLLSEARGDEGVDAQRCARRIRDLALEYGLLCAYTAFVAIDSTSQVDGELETVPVAVPVPEGVDFSTTVPERPGADGGNGEDGE